MARDAFQAAMNELPDTADPEVELDWIRCHPAMSRMARTGAEKVKITVRDIRSSSVGPAPSKSAVVGLCNWANMPEKFYQKLLADHSRRQKESNRPQEEEPEVVYIDTSDLKKMLAQAVSRETPAK